MLPASKLPNFFLQALDVSLRVSFLQSPYQLSHLLLHSLDLRDLVFLLLRQQTEFVLELVRLRHNVAHLVRLPLESLRVPEVLHNWSWLCDVDEALAESLVVPGIELIEVY